MFMLPCWQSVGEAERWFCAEQCTALFLLAICVHPTVLFRAAEPTANMLLIAELVPLVAQKPCRSAETNRWRNTWMVFCR